MDNEQCANYEAAMTMKIISGAYDDKTDRPFGTEGYYNVLGSQVPVDRYKEYPAELNDRKTCMPPGMNAAAHLANCNILEGFRDLPEIGSRWRHYSSWKSFATARCLEIVKMYNDSGVLVRGVKWQYETSDEIYFTTLRYFMQWMRNTDNDSKSHYRFVEILDSEKFLPVIKEEKCEL